MKKTGGHKICIICNNDYYVSGYRFENSKFCSRQCKECHWIEHKKDKSKNREVLNG